MNDYYIIKTFKEDKPMQEWLNENHTKGYLFLSMTSVADDDLIYNTIIMVKEKPLRKNGHD